MSETAAPAQTSPTQEADITSALGRRSVVLVGMMGAGKSTIGRRLAARLRLPFLDADIEIEAARPGDHSRTSSKPMASRISATARRG